MAAKTATDLTTGRMTARVESKITESLSDAINGVAKELAGGGDPRMFRSRAVRLLLVEGVKARAASRPTRRSRTGTSER